MLAKHAFYVCYSSYCLNVVIVDAVKAVPEADCYFFSAAKIICLYVRLLCSPEMAHSPKRNV